MSINVCNDRSMASITSLPSGVSGSSLVLLSTTTASSSATIDFTSGIDSTYKEYQVHAINIHPEENGRVLSFYSQAKLSDGRITAPKIKLIDLTGVNLRELITPSDASDPAWSGLLP